MTTMNPIAPVEQHTVLVVDDLRFSDGVSVSSFRLIPQSAL